MMRLLTLLISSALLLSACVTTAPTIGSDGKPLPQFYRISKGDTSRIQFRMLDSVNALRQAAGTGTLTLNAQLNAAAATHSRDMSVQNRPWHFGSDGSSPPQRAQRAGYTLTLLGENISETYETELETLAAWMEAPDTRDVIVDPTASDLGFAWYQETNGKIWWVLIVGGGATAPQFTVPTAVTTAPTEAPQG